MCMCVNICMPVSIKHRCNHCTSNIKFCIGNLELESYAQEASILASSLIMVLFS